MAEFVDAARIIGITMAITAIAFLICMTIELFADWIKRGRK